MSLPARTPTTPSASPRRTHQARRPGFRFVCLAVAGATLATLAAGSAQMSVTAAPENGAAPVDTKAVLADGSGSELASTTSVRAARTSVRKASAQEAASAEQPSVTGVSAAGSVAAETTALTSHPARRSDTMAEALGVCLVTSTVHGVWGNHSLIKSRLQELGVRYARSELYLGNSRQLSWIRELAAAGVRLNIIAGDPLMKAGTPEQLVALAAGQLPGAVASFEGANEWNLSGRPDWVRELRAHQNRLFRAVNGDARVDHLTVLGPALGMRKDREKLGDLTNALDVGNNHLYTGGFPPSYRVDDQLDAARIVSGDRPVMVTETGWHNALNSTETHHPTSEAAAGIYAPRLLLEYFHRRVPRIFVYELVNQEANASLTEREAHFGLLRNDFSRKPSFIALRNLMQLVSDRGAAFSPGSLGFGVSNAPADLRRVLVQRRDGTFLLFLWRDVAIWDPIAERTLSVAPVTVGVQLARRSDVRAYRPSTSGGPVSTTLNTSNTSVGLGGDVVALEIKPR